MDIKRNGSANATFSSHIPVANNCSIVLIFKKESIFRIIR